MIAEVEAVPEVYASVPILAVIGLERREHPQLYSTGVTIFRHRSNDLDGTLVVAVFVPSLNDFAERTLAKQLSDFV